jgi:hypothetical protein
VVYSFGDASKEGFGSSLKCKSELIYRSGQRDTVHEDHSSNYRELSNLVYLIEENYARGLLRNAELFIFTDNMTVESAFFKGTSSSEKLFELILKLINLQMNSSMMIHFIHVSGRRMIAQGTDGLSRGVHTQGVMQGADFLDFIPLHLSALDRQDRHLQDWIKNWFGSLGEYHLLDSAGWYHDGHRKERCVWSPAPAAADAALEQLSKSTHKRPHHMHLVLIPRLMAAHWRKMLGKICDLVFTVPAGTDIWSYSQYEPLIVGLYLPLSKHRPWKLRGTPMLERVERLLRKLPLSDIGWGRHILRKLLKQARELETLQESVVRSLLHSS